MRYKKESKVQFARRSPSRFLTPRLVPCSQLNKKNKAFIQNDFLISDNNS